MLGDHADPAEAGSASTGDRCRPASWPLPSGLGCSSMATLPSPALGPSQHARLRSLPRWLSTSTGRPRNYPSAFPHLAPRLGGAHLPRGSGKPAGSALVGRGVSCCPLAPPPPVIPETAGPCSGLTLAHACTHMHTHMHTRTRARAQAWLELRPLLGGAVPSGSRVLSSAPGRRGPSRCLGAHAAAHAWQPGKLVAANPVPHFVLKGALKSSVKPARGSARSALDLRSGPRVRAHRPPGGGCGRGADRDSIMASLS